MQIENIHLKIKGGKSMDDILTQAVWKMRSYDNNLAGQNINVTLIPTGGGSYQIYFPSKGCRYACTMCNYGFEHPVREEKIMEDLEKLCNNLPNDISNLILESSGSFLDEKELPRHLQVSIMKMVAKTDIPRVEPETHYTTITRERVKEIKTIFSHKPVSFELGLESTQPEVFNIYNKFIDLDELLKTIWMCDEMGIEVSLNVVMGAPLLTISEQIRDTLETVNWIENNCPRSTSIVLFPINIKDYTLVRYWYDKGRYEIVSDWQFIEMLAKIPMKLLGRVYISWYGNRCNEFHGEEAIIKPYHCFECEDELKAFYRSFVECKGDATEKAKLLKKISSYNCKCREEYETKKKGQKKINKSYTERLEEEKRRLKSELNL